MATIITPSNEGQRPGYGETVAYAYNTTRGMGRRISWGAVFAGVLVAIVTQMLLTLLGLGIGLSTIDPLEENNPAAGLGTGAAIWYGVSTLLSLFVGGWVAGRLAAGPRTFDNTLHGVLTWALTTLLTFYLLTTVVGRIIGGVTRFVGGTLSTVGSAVGTGAAAAAPELGDAIQREAQERGINLNNLQAEFNQVLRQTGKPGLQPEALERQADRATNQAQQTAERAASNPQAADQSVESLFNQFFRQGENTAQQFDREAMINVVVARTDQSRQEAAQTVDNWINTYNQARQQWQQTKEQAAQKAREAADQAAAATSRGALFGFLGLTLGLVAAGWGGRMGGNSRDDDSAIDHPVRETN
jgi:ElaB/YqjD/DUF883 family membrane-anchored ribosome-binding protein